MRGVQDGGRGRLVDLAALDAHEAVLDVVDAADAVPAAEVVHALAPARPGPWSHRRARRDPALEADGQLGGDVGRLARRHGPFVGVGRRRGPGVLEHAGLAGAAPEVDVDGVGRLPGDGDLDAALDGVVDLLVAREAHAHAHRRDDLEAGVEGVHGDVEADLVVALAGAAVGDGVAALAVGDLDEQLGDERACQGRGQRVDALVQRVGLQAGPHELADEAVAAIDHVGAAGAGRQGTLSDAVTQRVAAEVDRQGHDLRAVLLLEPGHRDRCIQPARVGEHDLLHLRTSEPSADRALMRPTPAGRPGCA